MSRLAREWIGIVERKRTVVRVVGEGRARDELPGPTVYADPGISTGEEGFRGDIVGEGECGCGRRDTDWYQWTQQRVDGRLVLGGAVADIEVGAAPYGAGVPKW